VRVSRGPASPPSPPPPGSVTHERLPGVCVLSRAGGLFLKAPLSTSLLNPHPPLSKFSLFSPCSRAPPAGGPRRRQPPWRLLYRRRSGCRGRRRGRPSGWNGMEWKERGGSESGSGERAEAESEHWACRSDDQPPLFRHGGPMEWCPGHCLSRPEGRRIGRGGIKGMSGASFHLHHFFPSFVSP